MARNLESLAYIVILLGLLLTGYWLLLPNVPGIVFWPSFAIITFLWFIYQFRRNRKDAKRLRKAFEIGIVLVFANIFVNYFFGAVQGGYIIEPSYSIFYVLGNPIELLLGSFFGGAGWFLYVPRKLDKIYSLCDILLLGFFGMMTEIVLIQNGILTYLTVDSANAFFTYSGLWLLLHFVYYKVLT